MTETAVGYHRDGFREARPAVNVKVYATINDPATVRAWEEIGSALGDDPDLGVYAGNAERLYRQAEEQAFARFWADAAEKAAELGLGPIEQEGRSGGWLVLTDGRDPRRMGYDGMGDDIGEEDKIEWLASYRALSEWCAGRVAAAPREIARLAREAAIEIVAHRSVTLRSWLAFGREGTL